MFDDLWKAWMRQAACGRMDPDLWTGKPGPKGRRFAIEICQSCIVRRDCLQYALDEDIWGGIWGGTTGDERRRMREAA